VIGSEEESGRSLRNSIRFVVGDGKIMRLQTDISAENSIMSHQFPRLFALSKTQACQISSLETWVDDT
jgi:hypothetical protein